MDILKYYQQKIVENKNFIFISITLAILLRIAFFTYTESTSFNSNFSNDSVLGHFFNSIIEYNSWLSFFLSIIFTVAITAYVAYINIEYNLVRVKTTLVYSLLFLVLSSNPYFVYMHYGYISLLLFIYCSNILFSAYQANKATNKAFTIGFFIAISSLVSFYFIFLILFFWLGFVFMRVFSFKTFLASLFGIISVYWLLFFYYIWQVDLDSFFNLFLLPIKSLEVGFFLMNFNVDYLIALAISILFLVIAIANNQIYSYKDTVQVRAMINWVNSLAIGSIICSLFFTFDATVSIYIYAISYSILIAHFFSTVSSKWQVILFYVFLVSLPIQAFLFL